jgi:hypothetical protein
MKASAFFFVLMAAYGLAAFCIGAKAATEDYRRELAVGDG